MLFDYSILRRRNRRIDGVLYQVVDWGVDWGVD